MKEITQNRLFWCLVVIGTACVIAGLLAVLPTMEENSKIAPNTWCLIACVAIIGGMFLVVAIMVKEMGESHSRVIAGGEKEKIIPL